MALDCDLDRAQLRLRLRAQHASARARTAWQLSKACHACTRCATCRVRACVAAAQPAHMLLRSCCPVPAAQHHTFLAAAQHHTCLLHEDKETQSDRQTAYTRQGPVQDTRGNARKQDKGTVATGPAGTHAQPPTRRHTQKTQPGHASSQIQNCRPKAVTHPKPHARSSDCQQHKIQAVGTPAAMDKT